MAERCAGGVAGESPAEGVAENAKRLERGGDFPLCRFIGVHWLARDMEQTEREDDLQGLGDSCLAEGDERF